MTNGLTIFQVSHIIYVTEPRTPLNNAYHAGSFNLRQKIKMAKQHQPPLNVEQQIGNLKAVGLVIEKEAEAKEFLNNVSYFRLIKAFGIKEKNSNFSNGNSFNKIKGLYIFNAKLRHLIFSQLEKVEVNLRCRIANYFSCKYGVLGYKDPNNFIDEEKHRKFLSDINNEINRNNRAAFVRNFKDNYVGGELPFYALIELFSFGMLSKFFRNMKGEDKKEIANFYGVPYTYLQSWFEHLAFVRNICAHYGRLYNAKFTITPELFDQYTDKGIGNLRFFASLICLKHLLPNDKHWKSFVKKLKKLMKKFPCAQRTHLGIPAGNWVRLLLVPMNKI